jgi:hypothetical protein
MSIAVALVIWALPAAGIAVGAESEWMVENQTFSALKVSEETLSLSGGPITLSASSSSTVVECAKVSGSGKVFKGGGDELAVTLNGCKVVKPVACQVGETVKMAVKTELVEVGEITVDKLVPMKVGEPLTTFAFTGVFCSLEKETPLKGSLAVQPSPEPGIKQAFEFSETISKSVNEALEEEEASPLSLTLGEAQASLTGQFPMALSGAQVGNPWARALRTSICKYAGRVNGGCTPNNTYIWKAGTVIRLENEGSMRLTFSGRLMTCAEAVLAGPNGADWALPLPGSFETAYFAKCTGSSGESCTATPFGQPYPFSIVRWLGTTAGNGYLWWSDMMIELECASPTLTCVYRATNSAEQNVHAFITGGNPAKVNLLITPTRLMKVAKGSDAACSNEDGFWEGSSLGVSAKYKIVEPTPLYVTG